MKQSMKQSILALFLIMSIQLANGQSPTVTYKVTNYTINGVSYDNLALENDVALSFYKCDNNTLCFANHWRNANSQSYGGVYSLKSKDIVETETTYAGKEIKFTWKFYNTYDSKRGEAAVSITNIYIGNTVKFTAEIIVLDTNEVLEFKGYLE